MAFRRGKIQVSLLCLSGNSAIDASSATSRLDFIFANARSDLVSINYVQLVFDHALN